MLVQEQLIELVDNVLNRHQLVHRRADPTHAAPTTPFADTVHNAVDQHGHRSAPTSSRWPSATDEFSG